MKWQNDQIGSIIPQEIDHTLQQILICLCSDFIHHRTIKARKRERVETGWGEGESQVVGPGWGDQIIGTEQSKGSICCNRGAVQSLTLKDPPKYYQRTISGQVRDDSYYTQLGREHRYRLFYDTHIYQ